MATVRIRDNCTEVLIFIIRFLFVFVWLLIYEQAAWCCAAKMAGRAAEAGGRSTRCEGEEEQGHACASEAGEDQSLELTAFGRLAVVLDGARR
jgi:hypothetical protein